MTSSLRWSIATFACFAAALLAVLAANVPPGRSAPIVCFAIAGAFVIVGLVLRFQTVRQLNRESRERHGHKPS
ncbi:hypothetical protein [Naumannella cuiyingiana]|uniref:Flp pilus assembly protein TadB n=1 Tax=Naumannella cuiyingiana TaxID=1347891 RepID=A0A7Z0IKI0_9ACTN|nr:hypothetical protein [Naumannella cuiyingiana]NYI70551.1 Flp pilus assembly protein TadB [Naumannella cuiyingiana]